MYNPDDIRQMYLKQDPAIDESARYVQYKKDLSRAEKGEILNTKEKIGLKDVIDTQYFIPRKIDILRIVAWANIARRELDTSQHKPEKYPIRMLDLGCGKAFLDKLIAEEIEPDNGEVIGIDSYGGWVDKAAQTYKDSKGLKLIEGDIGHVRQIIGDENIDLVIISWIYPFNDNYDYDPEINRRYQMAVESVEPPLVVVVSEESQEDTGNFQSSQYEKIAEWYGPISNEIASGQTEHFVGKKAEEILKKRGQGLFEVYMRKDLIKIEKREDGSEWEHIWVPADSSVSDYNNSDSSDNYDREKYPWENELEKLYPDRFGINYDHSKFWQDKEEGLRDRLENEKS